MKKINYIGLLLIVMVFSACDLDQYPYSEVAADKYVPLCFTKAAPSRRIGPTIRERAAASGPIPSIGTTPSGTARSIRKSTKNC